MERMTKRARFEENSISLQYLAKIHRLHEDWLRREPHTLIIDGEQEFEADPARAGQMIQDIKLFL